MRRKTNLHDNDLRRAFQGYKCFANATFEQREREDVCIGMLRTFVFFSSRRSLIAQNKTNNSTACVGTDEQHWLIGAYGKNDGVVAVQSLNMLRNILMGE